MNKWDKKILVVDFDGVLHNYDGVWQGPDVITGGAVPGMEDFLTEAVKHFQVCIYGSRSAGRAGNYAMQLFLFKRVHGAVMAQLQFPTTKPPAFVSLDDRGLTFTGVFPSMETLLSFKPWNKQCPTPCPTESSSLTPSSGEEPNPTCSGESEEQS